MFDIQEALRNLPDHPGVYIMKDGEGTIIYIGKAISLKNRVRQYFQSSKAHSPKVITMVSHIVEFEYILTDSELEALILECNLIKKHRPRYNIRLKDDKQYPYIKVTLNEEYPRVFMTRNVYKDGAKYFGPYTDVYAVRETMQIVKKMYPIRSCRKDLAFGKVVDRPCLNYHIHRCIAPCLGNVERELYMGYVKDIMTLLSGKHDELVKELKARMTEAASSLNFERAAEIRDQINSIQKIQEKQKIVSSDQDDKDVIAYVNTDEGTGIEVFFIRDGKLMGRESFYFNDVEEDDGEMLSQFITQFYAERESLPKELLIQSPIKEIDVIEAYLSGKRGSRVYVKVPQRGEKSQLIEMARKNAEASLEQMKFRMIKEKQMSEDSIEELRGVLDLDRLPYRLEAYDISNIQGTNPVGSMVVFEGGKPKNRDYRRFKIKTVEGPNDYASMEEVLTRRFKRGLEEIQELGSKGEEISKGKFSNLPDLILMDGGAGQVGIAERVLEEYGIEIPVCGMVKDDKHRTRGLIYRGDEIELYKDSNAFKLIARIQDEAHRVAIEYHRSLRSKGNVASVLDEIYGIGKKRRLALMNHFSSIDDVKKASVEELKKVEGMNEAAAVAVYEFFRNN
jgi:excinuclease ABC subunit C